MTESLPTREDHNNRIGLEVWDKRSFLDRYLLYRDPTFHFLDPSNISYRSRLNNNFYRTAGLALRLVDTRFRLQDISQSLRNDNELRIMSQKLEVEAWEKRAKEYLKTVTHLNSFFESCVKDFTEMERSSRFPDSEEAEFMEMGRLGRIGEIIVEVAPAGPYSYQDLATHKEPHFTQ